MNKRKKKRNEEITKRWNKVLENFQLTLHPEVELELLKEKQRLELEQFKKDHGIPLIDNHRIKVKVA